MQILRFTALIVLLSASAAPAQGIIAGEKKLNLVYIAWNEDPLPAQDVPTRATNALKSINGTWQAASFGKVWFTGKGYGYYRVPKRTVTSLAQFNVIQAEVRALATTAGDAWVSETTAIAWIPPNIGIYSQSWPNAWIIAVAGAKIDHEAGHFLGYMAHAKALAVNGASVTTPITQFDVMGQGGYGNYVQQRIGSGWVDAPGQPFTVSQLTGSGTFTLSSATLAHPTGPLGVLFCGGTHFVELRQGRVFVYRKQSSLVWYLLDLDPGAPLDQVLDAGQSYTPPNCGQTVTTVSANAGTSSTSAVVAVSEGLPPVVPEPTPLACVEGSTGVVGVSGQTYRVTVDAACVPNVQGPL